MCALQAQPAREERGREGKEGKGRVGRRGKGSEGKGGEGKGGEGKGREGKGREGKYSTACTNQAMLCQQTGHRLALVAPGVSPSKLCTYK